MKVPAYFGLAPFAVAAACMIASPAFAGPQGTGLTFTEEVAKKTLQKKAEAAAKRQASSGCVVSKTDKDGKPVQETCRAS